jgi:hypothetical protein
MTKFIIKRADELSPDNSVFNLIGFTGLAEANGTTNVDYKFLDERWITGGILLAYGGSWGDTITIQVLDKDNILGYGSNRVLREFITHFTIDPTSVKQQKIQVDYVSLIPAGIYIRLQYTNVSENTNVQVGCNLITHIPIA